jgi:hypothetical protein
LVLPGMAITGIATNACFHSLGQYAYTLGKSLVIETEGPAIGIELQNSDENNLPVSLLLHVVDAQPQKSAAVNLSMPAWSIVSKIEVWAEKMADANNQNVVISENTLLIEMESGFRLLICPEHPEQCLGLYCDEKEIETLLESGRYLLKHLID